MEKFTKILNSKKIILIQIIALFILSNLFLSHFRLRWDLSKNGRFTLTKSSEKILKSLQEVLYIDAYYSSEIPPEYKARIVLVQEVLKELAALSPKTVKLRFYDPDTSEKDKNRALEAGIEPQTLQKVDLGSAQVKSAFLGVSLRLGKEVEAIPVVFYAEEAEYQILSTVKKMLRREKKSSSGVALLEEEGTMKAPRPGPQSSKDTFGVFMHQVFASEYGPAFPFGINQDTLPEDIQVLFIAGWPQLTELGKLHLDQFLMNGGKIVFLPKTMDFNLEDRRQFTGFGLGQQGFAQPIQNVSSMNEFWSHYGFQIGTNMVADPSQSMPMGPLVQIEPGLLGRYHYPLWILASDKAGMLSNTSIFTKDLELLLFPWPSSIEVLKDKQPQAKFSILVETTKKAYIKKDLVFIGEKEVYQGKEEPLGEKIPLAIHIQGPFTSYFKDKPKPQSKSIQNFKEISGGEKAENQPEILIISSPYFISDLLLLREFRDLYQGANAPFLLNALDILQGDQDLIASRNKAPAFEPLEPFSEKEEYFYSIINIFLVPLGLGVYAFLRLKRRNSFWMGGN